MCLPAWLGLETNHGLPLEPFPNRGGVVSQDRDLARVAHPYDPLKNKLAVVVGVFLENCLDCRLVLIEFARTPLARLRLLPALQVIPDGPVGHSEDSGDLPLPLPLRLKDLRLHHTMLPVHGPLLGVMSCFATPSYQECPWSFFPESGKRSSVILGNLASVMTRDNRVE